MNIQSDKLEIRVTDAWVRLIRYCSTDLPHGEIKIKIVNSEPTKLLDAKPDVRFDKPDTLPIPKVNLSSMEQKVVTS